MKGLPGETEDRHGRPLGMDTILPEQFFALRDQRTWSGEQRLMAAILLDALAVYSRPGVARALGGGHVLRQTQHWVRSNDRSSTFSFLRVCEALGLEPDVVRRHLREGRGGGPAQGRGNVFARLKSPRRLVGD